MREPEISLVSGGRTGPIRQAHKEGEDRFSFQHLLMSPRWWDCCPFSQRLSRVLVTGNTCVGTFLRNAVTVR